MTGIGSQNAANSWANQQDQDIHSPIISALVDNTEDDVGDILAPEESSETIKFDFKDLDLDVRKTRNGSIVDITLDFHQYKKWGSKVYARNRDFNKPTWFIRAEYHTELDELIITEDEISGWQTSDQIATRYHTGLAYEAFRQTLEDINFTYGSLDHSKENHILFQWNNGQENYVGTMTLQNIIDDIKDWSVASVEAAFKNITILWGNITATDDMSLHLLKKLNTLPIRLDTRFLNPLQKRTLNKNNKNDA